MSRRTISLPEPSICCAACGSSTPARRTERFARAVRQPLRLSLHGEAKGWGGANFEKCSSPAKNRLGRAVLPRKTTERKSLPYRPGVGLMLFNSAGRIFVARRIDMPSEAWQMPQGGIDKGEDPRRAALRELAEEIGTDRAEIVAESPDWRPYDLPTELMGMLWGGRYRGQTQKWFLLRFTGKDNDIDIAT